MGQIHKLPSHIADQIAAGEVVERPASVVRELIENAIDAGATAIDVEIEDGGKRLVRVRDNGCGMDREDIELAVERHATSKIRTEEDLAAIRTLGFRGEAIPSIASVSRFSLTSLARGKDAGWRIRIDFGQNRRIEPAGCPEGTTVEVEDIFLKIPARLRFLKRRQTEAGHISQQVRLFAVAHPGIKFSLRADGRQVFRTSGNDSMPHALWPLVGKGLAPKLLPVRGGMQGVTLTGFVSPPEEGRSSSRAFYFFLNGRSIGNRLLWKALNEAAKGFFMSKTHPAGVLFLEIDPADVDVNVHPAKQEVRFHHSDAVFRTIFHSLKMTWQQQDSVLSGAMSAGMKQMRAETSKEEDEPGHRPVPLPWEEEKEAQKKERTYTHQGISEELPGCFGQGMKAVSEPCDHEDKLGHETPPEAQAPGPDIGAETSHLEDIRIIGQIDNSYILCEGNRGLLIIDQHAAHEGIIFKRLREQFEQHGSIPSQPLLFPKIIDVRPEDAARLDTLIPVLEKLGIEAEPFGPEQISIRTLPDFLVSSKKSQKALREILDRLFDAAVPDSSAIIHDVLASMACHSAVRANQRLDQAEMKALIDQMEEEGVSRCPHGRPVTQLITLTEIRRNFKRI